MVENKEKVKVKVENKDKGKVEDKVKVKNKDMEEKKKDDEKDKPAKPINLTIELTDQRGQMISFPLSRFSALQREMEVRIWKADFLKGEKSSEKVFQKFAFPLSELRALNPIFSPNQLHRIRFVFDKSENGVVVLDNVGFMKRFDLVRTNF